MRHEDPVVLGQTTRLVEFLRELATAGDLPQRSVDAYDEVFWLNEAPESAAISATATPSTTVLSLDLIGRVSPPSPPDMVLSWLQAWDAQSLWRSAPSLVESREVNTAPGESHLLFASDVPGVLDAYEQWLQEWEEWAEEDRRILVHRDWYERLVRIARRVAQDADQVEVVLGTGLLTWPTDTRGEAFRNHLLHTRVVIAEEETSGRIDVMLTDDAVTRFQDRRLLGGRPGYEPQRAEALRQEVRSRPAAPWSSETIGILNQWRTVSLEVCTPAQATWSPTPPAAAGSTAGAGADLRLAPALVLRPRDSTSLVDYYDQMLEALSGAGATVPLGLAQLITSMEKDERVAWLEADGAASGSVISEDPLFPLPANPEQAQVIDRLKVDSGVVVQGPPGTGKTHTIVNLVTALLARGQRVLVTSQKAQALQVLRDKMPPEVQDLCVSMTDLARGGSQELTRSVNTLADRHARHHPERQTATITALRQERLAQRSRVSALKEEVRALRESETYQHPQVAPGYEGLLANIAALITRYQPRDGWMPLPVPAQAAVEPPLEAGEAQELRRLLVTSTPQRAARPTQSLPEVTSFTTGAALRSLVVAEQSAHAAAREVSSDLSRSLERVDDHVLAEVQQRLRNGSESLHSIRLPDEAALWDPKDWRAAACLDLLARREVSVWESLRDAAPRVHQAREGLRRVGMREVQLPDFPATGPGSTVLQLSAAHELLAWLEGGEKLRRWPKPAVQRRASLLLEGAAVDGAPISGPALLRVVIDHLEAVVVAGSAVRHWATVGHHADGPAPLIRQIAQLTDAHDTLEHAFTLAEARDDIEARLRHAGADVRVDEPRQWAALDDALHAVTARSAAQVATSRLGELVEELNLAAAGSGAPPEIAEMARAVEVRDVEAYSEALTALAAASVEQQEQRRCDALLAQLSVHPALASLMARTATDADVWATRFATWREAWHWGRARTFFDVQRTPGREQALGIELDAAIASVQELTARQAAAEAWQHALAQMSASQVQALRSYQQHMSDRGAGYSKFDDRILRAAKQALSVAQGAVPAWIMPLPEVLDTMPAERNSFDVVIVDEASQASLDALFLLWLAPRVIVVGDDRQCAPSITRQGQLQPIFDKLDQYLPDLPLYLRNDFTPRSSLFSLLQPRFGAVVRLKEHFRCMPEIINYSSATFYQDMPLVPLRQFGADRLDPVKIVHVQGAVTEGSSTRLRNEVEAEQLVDQLVRCSRDPAYAKRTFGVVVMQGTGQVELIRSLLEERLPREQWNARKVRVGTPPDFQGDERHVVFLSMVIASKRTALTKRDWQRRFNVAASRAQDQMWVFSSVTADLLSPVDLRRGLLEYARNPPVAVNKEALDDVTPDVKHPRFDSLFEQRVFLRIRERGFHVTPQFEVNGRRIDLVVTGGAGRLAVECDGVAWHSSPSQVAADLDRELELKRAGWRFWRVRDSEFNYDPETSLAPLWDELTRRGISPYTPAHGSSSAADEASSAWSPQTLSEEEGFDGLEGDEPEQLDSAPAAPTPSTVREPPVRRPPTTPGLGAPPFSGESALPAQTRKTHQQRADRDLHTAARAWARANNIPVGERGSLQDRVISAYLASQEDIPTADTSTSVSSSTSAGVSPEAVPEILVGTAVVPRSASASAPVPTQQSRDLRSPRHVPTGFTHVAWVRPDEAAAVLEAVSERRTARVYNRIGEQTGRVAYFPDTDPQVRRTRINTLVQRFRRNDRPEDVAWVSEEEAHALIEAIAVEGDVRTENRASLVQWFESDSKEKTKHGSQLRLLRR